MGRPILLAGLMLAGKTTVGRALARRLGWAFLDLDDEIARRSGRSVAEWFEEGEPAFRAIEAETLAAVLNEGPPRVVALGGGALERAESLALCRERGFLVYLEASPAELAARLGDEERRRRPLLAGAVDATARLGELLATRESRYHQAHWSVAVGGRTPEAVAEEIADRYGAGEPHG
jgi:shikimate kinase